MQHYLQNNFVLISNAYFHWNIIYCLNTMYIMWLAIKNKKKKKKPQEFSKKKNHKNFQRVKAILAISFICWVKTYLDFIGIKEINLFLWKMQKLQEIKNKINGEIWSPDEIWFFALHVKFPSLGGWLSFFDPISLLNIHLPPKKGKTSSFRPHLLSFIFKLKRVNSIEFFNEFALLSQNIVAAFRGMHVSPAKHSYAWLPDRQTDTRTDTGQRDPYVPLCFAGDTKSVRWVISYLKEGIGLHAKKIQLDF